MRIAKLFLSVVFICLVLVGILALMIETVPVARTGVRVNNLKGGVVQEDFKTGFHLGITGVHKWHFLDKRTHFLTFASHGTNTQAGRTVEALTLRTKDNNLVTFDISVTYRIIEGQAHKLVDSGKQDIYRDRLVAIVENVLREELAQLSSEDFYSTDTRLRVAETTKVPLAEAMQEFFVKPDQVLIRAIRFSEEYESQLQAKQLTYQKRLLAEALKEVEDRKAVTEELSAEIVRLEKERRGDWDKRLQQELSANNVKIATVIAEAGVYDRQTRSEATADFETDSAVGRLAVDKAEALRNELRNQALDTLGGRIFLARQAADNLNFDHVTLNSNDPSIPSILNIDELVKMLVGTQSD